MTDTSVGGVTDAVRQVADGSSRLIEELRTTVRRIHALAMSQFEALRASGARKPGRIQSLDEIKNLYGPQLQALLLDPIDGFRHRTPAQACLEAFDDFDRTSERLLRGLPRTVTLSGRQWADLFGPPNEWTARMTLWLRGRQAVEARPVLLLALHEGRRSRRRLDSRLLVPVQELSLDLVTAWHVARRSLMSPEPAGLPASAFEADLQRHHEWIAEHARRADEALAAIDAWQQQLLPGIVRWFAGRRGRATRRIDASRRRDDRYREFLGRQVRSVDAEIDLAARLGRSDQGLIDAAAEMYASIGTEHRDLLAELNAVLVSLERWRPGATVEFTSPGTEIIPAPTRLRAFAQTALAPLASVPQAVELSRWLRAGPGLSAWTTQRPREIVGDSLELIGLPVFGEGVGALEHQHQGIVQAIERVREVVSFARETARGEAPDEQIEQEGVDNARALLQFHHERSIGIPPEVEAALVDGLLRTFDRVYRVLDEGQLGVVRRAGRDGLERAARVLGRRASRHGREAAIALGRAAARVYRTALVRIGWLPAPAGRGARLVTRGYLTQTLGAEARLEQLPMIYRRLFRLTPVVDPRFLVGRDDELAAMADARRLWEQGRDAGVLLVGVRGSGKTSLINCAAQRDLAGLDVVRSEFVDRLTTRDAMQAFLAELLGVSRDGLEPALHSRRRVIVLEELERTFVRGPGGFGAIRHLLGLISRSSRHNLWIVSMNHACFRLLDAALRIEPHFSHVINATAVELPHLREAILMRHNLSGLRLRFAPPGEPDSSRKRILRLAGVRHDPESEFFDALYRESGGVFRSAFALWQRYIDRAEGGVLYLKYPTRPEYGAIVESLSTLDLFTLAALQQHGSLTPVEHAFIFQIDETRSRSWLDNLLARELIEPDPGRFGFRVVPDAVQVVRQTLFRRNLG